jgi:hypothetical protein
VLMVEMSAVRIAVNKDNQSEGLSMAIIPFVGGLVTSIRVILDLLSEFGSRAFVCLGRSLLLSRQV